MTGAWFYFGYKHQGKSRKAPLAPYDADGKRGLTLLQARDRAAELGKVYRSGITDIGGYLRREAAARAQADEARELAAARELELARQGSLAKLLDEYVAHLEHQGKVSAGHARSCFRHVPDELLQRRAAQLAMTDFLSPINALVDAGKGRMADMVRTYLRAAFGIALASQSDPALPQALRDFGIMHNPVADVSARSLRQFKKAGKRALTDDELAGYLHGLEGLTEYLRDALTVALYLGGQRPQQLLRVTWANVDLGTRTVMLLDPKGRRQQPRIHLLPLTAIPLAILKRRHEQFAQYAQCEPRVFATAHAASLSRSVGEISAALVRDKIAREPFMLRDIRRTCETMMARLKVPKHVRAQLQSHGLGGVQDRHYDMYEYMDEKREALERWAAHLESLRQRPAPDTAPEGEGPGPGA